MSNFIKFFCPLSVFHFYTFEYLLDLRRRRSESTKLLTQIFATTQNNDFGLKIIDFGLAQDLGSQKCIKLKKMQGTLEFMSPEVRNELITETPSASS